MIEKSIIKKLDEYNKKMNEVPTCDYMYAFKQITDMYYYFNRTLRNNDDPLVNLCVNGELFDIRKKLPLKYITEFDSCFKEKTDEEIEEDINTSFYNYTNEEDILDFIVSVVRNKIYKENITKGNIYSFDSIVLDNKCLEISNFVADVCDLLNIKNKIYKINPGFCQDLRLYEGYGYHFFNEITIDNKKYIIDCSYSQFFKMNNNNPLLLNFDMDGCLPGIFMIQNTSRLQTAKNLLEFGWVEATDKNIKNYFDGFAISFRNGLYYKDMENIYYTTDYTAKDYMKMLKTSDNQAKREDIKCLGYPDTLPLMYDIDFSKNIRFFENEKDNKEAKKIVKRFKEFK